MATPPTNFPLRPPQPAYGTVVPPAQTNASREVRVCQAEELVRFSIGGRHVPDLSAISSDACTHNVVEFHYYLGVGQHFLWDEISRALKRYHVAVAEYRHRVEG